MMSIWYNKKENKWLGGLKMAIVDVDFYAESLYRQTSYKAIIPTKELDQFPDGLPTLYLLHGLHGNDSNWLYHTNIVKIAEKFNIAVILPNGENSFYIDHEERRNYYGKLIGEELVTESRKLFPLSHKREDTFIGGLSMGGYGALRNGLKYCDTFGGIIAFSSALLQKEIMNPKKHRDDHPFGQRDYIEATFGPIDQFHENENNMEYLIKVVKESGKTIPELYIACGTDDDLIEQNRAFHHYLEKLNIKHTYIETEGAHDWAFWSKEIEPAVRWLYQLNRMKKGNHEK